VPFLDVGQTPPRFSHHERFRKYMALHISQ